MVLSSRTVHIVSVHSAGEIGDVIVGGVLDDELRQLLLNEPRGRPSCNVNLVLPPCDPRADAGFLLMESEEYAPMSGSNTICTTTALLETGMIKTQEPFTTLKLDTAAGLNVAFDNVPAFVFHLDLEVEVPGLGKILCDIAWGGMMYAIVDMAQTDLTMNPNDGQKIGEYGERIKRAVQATVHPVHPENLGINGVTNFIFTAPLEDGPGGKKAQNAVVVSPGRLDRTPCGTGTCARMAQLYARKQMAEGESFQHTSIIETEYTGTIVGVTKVGNYEAVLPRVKGSAWITSFRLVVLDPTDPFPEGFRVGDAWHPRSTPKNLVQ
ncbi:proline racemase [Penicillium malachiteum]|uniref:proline racemase n=1 Tax=Penicillium malachiteum TaxID=1324776 RepID=UPI0025491E95|nr:proline racemase [Penicillium malachiteum]KAJ5718826.1 proline racemase [Penicillium malachiteum]